MKTQYVLPVIFALGTVVASTQAMATGLTYDPYADYYSAYYGIGAETTAPIVSLDKGIDAQTTTPIVSLDDDMADPRNYYNW